MEREPHDIVETLERGGMAASVDFDPSGNIRELFYARTTAGGEVSSYTDLMENTAVHSVRNGEGWKATAWIPVENFYSFSGGEYEIVDEMVDSDAVPPLPGEGYGVYAAEVDGDIEEEATNSPVTDSLWDVGAEMHERLLGEIMTANEQADAEFFRLPEELEGLEDWYRQDINFA